MNREFEMVREFHKAFGVPRESSPKPLEITRGVKRCKWMLEEISEFLEAEDICGQADAMIDLIYFALGTLVEMGVEPDRLFEIVHKANMAKLFPDGKPRYKDTKVIKPENWQDPEPLIKEEIGRQSGASTS